MRTFTYYLIIVAIFSFYTMKGQSSDINKNSEFVFVKDQKLVQLLKDIICKENACQDPNKKIHWYVDFKEEFKSIIITQGRIADLMELNDGEKVIYTTTINENIVFLLLKNKSDSLLSETGFQMDLSSYLGRSTLVFEDFSAWLVTYNNGVYKLKDTHIRKCD